jgi:hypothetical protein
MERFRIPLFVVSVVIVIPLMLVVDGPDLRVQLLNGAFAFLLVFTAARSGSIPGIQIAVAMTIATTGELILSLGWGLYAYRFAVIPWYVPPGHGIFYLLTAETAAHPRIVRHRKAVIGAVLVFGSALAALCLVLGRDAWGLAWWLGAGAMMLLSRSGLVVACAWVYTTPMEWLGTWNENWVWFREVPGIPLPSGNPPSGVAVLYGLLDILTILACSSPLLRRLAEGGRSDRSPASDSRSPAVDLAEI